MGARQRLTAYSHDGGRYARRRNASLNVEADHNRLPCAHYLEHERSLLGREEGLELNHVKQDPFLRAQYYIAGLQSREFRCAAFDDLRYKDAATRMKAGCELRGQVARSEANRKTDFPDGSING